MNSERNRGSLLDLACTLLFLYFLSFIFWNRGALPPRHDPERFWRGVMGEAKEAGQGPGGVPSGPNDERQRFNEEAKREGRGGP